MKTIVTLISCLIIITSFFTGCAPSDNTQITFVEPTQENHNRAIQEASDRGYAANEFAEENFIKHMKNNNQYNYTIEQTNCGFIASELPEYIVGFKYIINEKTEYYGYKINVDDNHKCVIIEEGTETANFIFS